MSSALVGAADEIRRQLKQLVDEIKAEPRMVEALKLHEALNTIERLNGAEPTSLAEVFGLDATPQGPKFKVAEFYELTALDAAKRYLKKVGEARPLSEIIATIREYGGKVPSEEDLRLSLSRSTWDVAKVGTDLYGLVEFYPHVKRGKKKKGAIAQEADHGAGDEPPPVEEPPPMEMEPPEQDGRG